MSKCVDLTGMTFGRLTAKELVRADKSKGAIWRCECSCGGEKEVLASRLRSKKTQSCGCLYNETRQDCPKARKDIADHTSISALVSAEKPNKKNTSGHTGVYQDKRSGKWCAYINFKKKRYSLGTFQNKDDALKARIRAEERFHDPMIIERLNNLTAEPKAEFLEYLHQRNEESLSPKVPGGNTE